MNKNLALFIDGTGNNGPRDEADYRNTNVHKLYEACQDLKLYQAGVGSSRFGIIGGITGFGTKKRLQEAYRFLVGNYSQGDSIYIFGFSRGALAARLFAGFLGYVGTLFGKPPFEDYLPFVYRLFESAVALDVVGHFSEYLGSFGERPTALPIHFLGVWDTVERYYPKRHIVEIETLAHHITHARHAIAIHERRKEMEPTLWKKWGQNQTVKQVWFPGAHSDVGGGYPESGLAEIALLWMYDEAQKAGLSANIPKRYKERAILHQQRTDNRAVGAILAVLLGEVVRTALTPDDNSLLGSMNMSDSALQHLELDPITDIHFVNYPPGSGKEALDEVSIADEHARKLLQRIRGRRRP
jgi:uncharacterized protein (DUF2235 family)